MVAAVLGSKTVEVLGIQDYFSTHGTREHRHAKHGHSPESPSVSGKALLNKKALTLLMVIAR